MFAVCLWEIWIERCKSRFDNSYKGAVQKILFRISDWKARFQTALDGSSCHSRTDYQRAVDAGLHPRLTFVKSVEIVKWIRPVVGKIKVNCDGSAGADGLAGGGAIVRDSDGDFLGAASWFYGRNSSLEAELLAVRDGIRFAQDLGYSLSDMEVESDSIMVVKSLQLTHSMDSVQKFNWKEVISKIRDGCCITHIYREVNGIADILAKRGRVSKSNSHFFDLLTLPPRVSGSLYWEKHDLPYIRRKS